MKRKQTALVLMLFIGCGTLLWAQSAVTENRLVPFTWEIANNTENLKKLHFFLSLPISLTPPGQNNVSMMYDVNEKGTLVGKEQNVSPNRIEFNSSDIGTLSTIGRANESFVITFKGTELEFIKNSHGRYDLFSAKFDSKFYPVSFRRPVQLLIINAESNDRVEVRAVPDSEQGGSRRFTNDQPSAYRDSGQSYQTINIKNSPNQFSGRPSKDIDGRSYVNKRGIAAYAIRQNPSVNRDTLNRLIDTYINEAGIEGINIDIAIAQMLYATNFLSNQQRMISHNYAGLSTNGLRWDGSFYNMTTGVRAHIQHLKGYVSTRPLRTQIVDPRYQILVDLGYRGRVKTFVELFTLWTASPASYARSINEILNGLYWFSGNY